MRKKSFSLIELICVIAILGILVAIMLPRFINAQTKTTICQTVANMKAIGTSLELYNIDYCTYPKWRFLGPPDYEPYYLPLTTPISYITNAFFFHAPFQKKKRWDEDAGEFIQTNKPIDLIEGVTSPYAGYTGGPFYGDESFFPRIAWKLISNGPTCVGCCNNEDIWWDVCLYNLSNGLHSSGQIHRFGGEAAGINLTY